jgi:uncharacterized protein (DUF1778 family)
MARDQVLQLRLSRAERKAMNQAARAAKKPVTRWLRELALREARAKTGGMRG